MKVLITGITGFVGSHLAIHLNSLGYEVAGLSRPGSSPPEFLSKTKLWSASEDGEGFREALTRFRPDVVVHLAALYIPEHRAEDIAPLMRANIQYGTYLLEAMQEAGCNAMVFAGTSWQHYHDASYCPANLYAATKQAFSCLADYYRDAHGLRLLELHLYDCYGPSDPRKKLIHHLQNSARSGLPLPMSNGEQRIHLLHIDDLTRGLSQACGHVLNFSPAHRALYRLPSPEAISLRELVTQFNEANPGQPAQIVWGKLPYRKREIFSPWEEGEVLPGWAPHITLAKGLRNICR
ncbi:NAD(P)-dependent oxidoreductase [Azonexus sp.]|uniref:NAD-dependent epimerase/dehydratase family protein n=1 Tax=Azonexus sp. TaxID=1872668 RepID=UPI0027B8B248|nr:NAD-dependent epimerase/dehydratase family protein [Azonexus sp.]